MTAPDVTDPDLQSVAWDLTPLLDGGADDPDAAVTGMVAEAQKRSDAFAAAHAGKVGELDGPGLVAAMHELEAIQDLLGRAGSYAMLSFSFDTADPVRGALLQKLQEGATGIETTLLFFELEWAGLDDERAEELLAADGLDFARHHLRTARRYRPHLLSEPEEKILAEKALTGRTAWTRLFEEQASGITVELEDADEPVSLEIALSRLFAPDRDVRRDAAERVTAALEPGLRTRGYVLNTLLADKMVDDRLRNYPHWLAEPQPRQRGIGRVGRGADLGGPRALRAAAPLVPPEGAAAGARQARRLRPDGGRHAGAGKRRVGAREGDRARLLPRVLRRAGVARAALLRRVVDRRAGAAEQARRCVLRLHGAVLAPLRAPELHVQRAATC